MKKRIRKMLTLLMSAMLLVCLTVGATYAYLTSSDTVTNTFSVGKVAIKLDEAKVDANGAAITGDEAERVQANSYKLMPGHTYDKDPMVTVLADSEPSYIRMKVTVTKANELDAIFAPTGADLTSIFTDYDEEKWILNDTAKDAQADTITYEFRYYTTVDTLAEGEKAAADKALEPLFKQIVVPGTITNAQLNSISDMTITVVADAIQADGFKDADDAWGNFSAPAKQD